MIHEYMVWDRDVRPLPCGALEGIVVSFNKAVAEGYHTPVVRTLTGEAKVIGHVQSLRVEGGKLFASFEITASAAISEGEKSNGWKLLEVSVGEEHPVREDV